MTTDELQQKVAEIDSAKDITIGALRKHTPAEVINAGTYQGFTDEEIQGVVDFYVNLAHQDEQAKAYTAAYLTEMNERVELMKSQYEEAKARMEKVLSDIPARAKIGKDGFPEAGGTQ